MAKKINSQEDQRLSNGKEHGDIFTDVHGRMYHAEVELSTSHPCSPFRPMGWKAPLDTPQNYMKYVRDKRQRDEHGRPIRRGYDIEITYDKWIADWAQAGKRWDQDAIKLALAIHKDAWKDRKTLPEDVRLQMGERPGARLAAVEAAKQGQPYVLGLRPFDPKNKSDVELRNILEPQVNRVERDWLATEKVSA